MALQGAHGKELSQSLTLLSDSPHKVKNTSLDFVLLFQMAFPFVPLHLLICLLCMFSWAGLVAQLRKGLTLQTKTATLLAGSYSLATSSSTKAASPRGFGHLNSEPKGSTGRWALLCCPVQEVCSRQVPVSLMAMAP